jgi:hypothetical protein
MIEKGGWVENLWQHGGHGEHNLSVFTVRNLPGIHTAYLYGMDKTGLSFGDRVNWFGYGYGDPPDSKRVTEIEYDPAKIRAAQIEQQRAQAQAREIEQSQRQEIDKGHEYSGFSR